MDSTTTVDITAKESASLSSTESTSSSSSVPNTVVDTIVQYIVIRKDLKWPTGALIAQGCHACVSALWLSKDHPATIDYCKDMDNMHKITLEATSAETLTTISSSLTAAGIVHKLWIEQPENIPTCIATAPLQRSILKPFFNALKLLR